MSVLVTTGSLADRALTTLKRHVSGINASVITQHALRSAQKQCGTEEVPTEVLLSELSSASAMFLQPGVRKQVQSELLALADDAQSQSTFRVAVPIRVEGDLKLARLSCRELCQKLGVNGFLAQKILTAVSEVARNIAKYAGEGLVTFSADSVARVIVVTAEDKGPGIPNIDQIYAGLYHSKTGMGRGILGVKKLADDFDLVTGPKGTTVTLTFTRV